jgi:hypothetical protein
MAPTRCWPRTALRALPPGERRDMALGSLTARLPRLQYPTSRAAGYPIGSGIGERANTVVVQDRRRGSGRHWAPARVDRMLALRTVVCADRWDEARPRISARRRVGARARRRQLRADRRAACDAARPASLTPAPSLPETTGSPLVLTSPTTPTHPDAADSKDHRQTIVRPSSTVAPPRPIPGTVGPRRFPPHRSASPAEY